LIASKPSLNSSTKFRSLAEKLIGLTFIRLTGVEYPVLTDFTPLSGAKVCLHKLRLEILKDQLSVKSGRPRDLYNYIKNRQIFHVFINLFRRKRQFY